MSKKMKLSALALCLTVMLLSLASCMPTSCRVVYVFGDGRDNIVASNMTLNKARVPEPPSRENYIFTGWYRDAALTQPYDFEMALSGDLVLYAGWQVDYNAFSRNITSSAMSACLTVKTKNQMAKTAGSVLTSTGSGVIYKKSGGYYYFLTNQHVTEGEPQAILTEYFAYDAYGNEYKCELLHTDSLYDLSLLRFKAGNKELQTLQFRSGVPNENEVIVALGTPDGRQNAQTYGNVKNFAPATDGGDFPDSDVLFAVYWHDAFTDHGSSGGPILDVQLQVVGINFATAAHENGEFAFGFAIPSDKAIEFIAIAEAITPV